MSSQFPDVDHRAPEVSAAELKDRLDGGERVTILDTRRPEDFEEWHVEHPNAELVNVPFTEFVDGDDPVDTVPSGVPEGPLVTCCAKGISSGFVADLLAREGWEVEGLADGMEGWARLYDAYTVHDGDLTVRQYHRPSSGCLGYLVVAGGEAAVIDPLRAFTDRYVEDAESLGARIRWAVDTHVHADHVSGVRELAAETGATPVLPDGASERGLAFDAHLVSAGGTLPVGEESIGVVDLPGHTSEMVGYRAADVLVTGDTVFLDGVARPDLEDADAAADAAGQLYETVQRVSALPDDVVVAPGHDDDPTPPGDHGFTATVGDLRDRLWAFGADREAFVDRLTGDLPPQPANYEQIIATNLGRDSVDDETAFELELGPNNCAAG